ncbi:MAG: 5-formyltetrahydrofolate cyclo-ligase [Pseudonocardia sp.]
MTVREEKKRWRRRLRAARSEQPADVRAARGAALAAAVVELARTLDPPARHRPICAYLPVDTEPGWAAGLDALVAAGHEVLLPVVPPEPGPLDWARYEGPAALGTGPIGLRAALGTGPIGLREPTGPRLGPAAIKRAVLVLVPALAADRRGVRIGQGGGYYDMTLPLAAPGTPLVVVLNDEELVTELPVEPHDRRVTAALLAEAGLIEFVRSPSTTAPHSTTPPDPTG